MSLDFCMSAFDITLLKFYIMTLSLQVFLQNTLMLTINAPGMLNVFGHMEKIRKVIAASLLVINGR